MTIVSALASVALSFSTNITLHVSVTRSLPLCRTWCISVTATRYHLCLNLWVLRFHLTGIPWRRLYLDLLRRVDRIVRRRPHEIHSAQVERRVMKMNKTAVSERKVTSGAVSWPLLWLIIFSLSLFRSSLVVCVSSCPSSSPVVSCSLDSFCGTKTMCICKARSQSIRCVSPTHVAKEPFPSSLSTMSSSLVSDARELLIATRPTHCVRGIKE